MDLAADDSLLGAPMPLGRGFFQTGFFISALPRPEAFAEPAVWIFGGGWKLLCHPAHPLAKAVPSRATLGLRSLEVAAGRTVVSRATLRVQAALRVFVFSFQGEPLHVFLISRMML